MVELEGKEMMMKSSDTHENNRELESSDRELIYKLSFSVGKAYQGPAVLSNVEVFIQIYAVLLLNW